MSEPFEDPLVALGPALKNLVRLSTSLNQQDVAFYQTIDSDVNTQAINSNNHLVDLMNKLVSSCLSITPDLQAEDFQMQLGSNEENFNALSNVLDTLFENVEIALDNHHNKRETNTKSIPHHEDGYTYLDENDAKSGQPGQKMAPKLMESSNIDKPQTEFVKKVDNFESQPFKPLITMKPNAVKSLEESLALVPAEDEVPAHYENPYAYEITNSEYPSWILEPASDEYISVPWKESKPAIWISDPSQLKDLLIDLKKSKVIAIDLEHHDYRTYHGLTSLMQITSESKQDYLIDPLSPELRPHLTMLNEVFTDPNIVKVLHGAFMDIIWLQRDLGLYIVSLFDTYHASKQLSLQKHSLAFLLEKYVKFRTSKKWQLADWRIRPLSPEMMDYAKADTHFLIEVFYKMQRELLKIPEGLQRTLYESRKVSNRRFEYSTYAPYNLKTMKSPNVVATNMSVPLSREIQDEITTLKFMDRDLPWQWLIMSNGVSTDRRPLLEILFKWRDQRARKDDESPRYIMSDFTLMSLVNSFGLDTSLENVNKNTVLDIINKSSKFGGGVYVRKHIDELVEIIQDAVETLKGLDMSLLNKLDESTPSQSAEAIVDQEQVYQNVKDVNKLQDDFQSMMTLFKPKKLESSTRINFIQKEKAPFAIEYDTNSIRKVDSIENRIHEVVEYFQEDQVDTIQLDVAEEAEAQEQDEEARNAEIRREQERKAIEEKEEIVTLKKRKNGPTPMLQKGQEKKQKKVNDSDMQLDFLDFNKSVMGDANSDKRQRGKKTKGKPRQEPAFDPYSKIESANGEIPQLKKQKRVDRGRNAVVRRRK